jgi:hypothetical protein
VLNPLSEADLVESAFEDEVKLLYKNLCVGLNGVGGVPRPADEQQCLQRFKTGLTLARRARELALSAVTPAASAHVAAHVKSLSLLGTESVMPPEAAPSLAPPPSRKPRARHR